MKLDYRQFVDLSKMSGDARVKLFPILKTKSWRCISDKFFILFKYPANHYNDGEVDEEADYYDGYADNFEDRRKKWIDFLKIDGVTQQVYINDIGEL